MLRKGLISGSRHHFRVWRTRLAKASPLQVLARDVVLGLAEWASTPGKHLELRRDFIPASGRVMAVIGCGPSLVFRCPMLLAGLNGEQPQPTLSRPIHFRRHLSRLFPQTPDCAISSLESRRSSTRQRYYVFWPASDFPCSGDESLTPALLQREFYSVRIHTSEVAIDEDQASAALPAGDWTSWRIHAALGVWGVSR